ncbi:MULTISPECIES: preprotein translocase subunit SecB [unclassified Colwellia]|uniref:preprotein translocase subunit SecB n=1 Tax=unclassified Colwellia TaxID=196834 RepID=UPI0015F61D70|nr:MULTISPECIES: preprotein translocase subunit SecB [unclassified Colwellia]MBA6257456.1 preprotein translocase subunit SecB [Colwellia sp. MB3u-28]MBA6260528.1 preprotein translocase subunit SecB [Colwellia sp. MB3u-41]
MTNKNLREAIDNLEIRDVYVKSLIANSADDFEPKYFENFDSLTQQNKHLVSKSSIMVIDGSETEPDKVFRVHVEYGMRWTEATEQEGGGEQKAIIEAEFVVEYLMKKELHSDCLNAFALKNASFHVWPYWRELVSSQCERMQMPRIIMPTLQLASNRNDQHKEK